MNPKKKATKKKYKRRTGYFSFYEAVQRLGVTEDELGQIVRDNKIRYEIEDFYGFRRPIFKETWLNKYLKDNPRS